MGFISDAKQGLSRAARAHSLRNNPSLRGMDSGQRKEVFKDFMRKDPSLMPEQSRKRYEYARGGAAPRWRPRGEVAGTAKTMRAGGTRTLAQQQGGDRLKQMLGATGGRSGPQQAAGKFPAGYVGPHNKPPTGGVQPGLPGRTSKGKGATPPSKGARPTGLAALSGGVGGSLKPKTASAHEIVEDLVKVGALSPESAERARVSAEQLTEKVAGLLNVGGGQVAPTLAMKALGATKDKGKLIQRLMSDPVGTAPALAAGGAAVTAGGMGAGYLGHHTLTGADALVQAMMKGRRFDKMMDVNPELGGYDENSLHLAFNTLHRFNPDMASDPLVAGTFVRRVMDAQGIDTKTVGEIARARGGVPGIEAAKGAPGAFGKAVTSI